jgi:hypothetical protein
MCTCPDTRCRVHWSVAAEGGWRVVTQDPGWGEIPMTFHPDDGEIARWVARGHNVPCDWIEPTSEPVSQ